MTHPREAELRQLVVEMRTVGSSWTYVAEAMTALGTVSVTGRAWGARTARSYALDHGWVSIATAPASTLRGDHVYSARQTRPRHRTRVVAECGECGAVKPIAARGVCGACLRRASRRAASTGRAIITRLVGMHGATHAATTLGVDVRQVAEWVGGADVPDDAVALASAEVERFTAVEESRNPWRPVPIYDARDRMIDRQAVG